MRPVGGGDHAGSSTNTSKLVPPEAFPLFQRTGSDALWLPVAMTAVSLNLTFHLSEYV